MAKISKLEMAPALLSREDIDVKSSFFGLTEKAVYTPTGSPLRVVTRDYQPETLARLERILDAGERMAEVAAGENVLAVPVGNVRIEACISADRAFAAVQLLRFSNYLYRPVGEPRFYTGAEASMVATLLK